jgi:hypothetical protein
MMEAADDPEDISLWLYRGITGGNTGLLEGYNSLNWARRYLSKFTGVHCGAGAWTQSYGLQAISPWHLISCAHNGPGIGGAVNFISPDGDIFSTNLAVWINDYPGVTSSDTKQTLEADVSIYRVADELPEWVCMPKAAKLSSEQKAQIHALKAPLLAVSQGSVSVDRGRKIYAINSDLSIPSGIRALFSHLLFIGDSGTPQFVCAYDNLWLYRIVSYGNGAGTFVADHLPYINSMIERSDIVAEEITGAVLEGEFPRPL